MLASPCVGMQADGAVANGDELLLLIGGEAPDPPPHKGQELLPFVLLPLRQLSGAVPSAAGGDGRQVLIVGVVRPHQARLPQPCAALGGRGGASRSG